LRLWLIRHGETAHNIQRVFQGQLDTPLTNRGVEQARVTAAALKLVPFDRIYASDLQRAFETARPLGMEVNLEVEPDIRLREMHYGVLQGVDYVNFREVLRSHGVGDDWGSGVFSENGSAPPGGESLSDLVERTSAFISEVVDNNEGASHLGVVTHGGTIRTIMTEMLGMPPASRSALIVANCGVTCFLNEGGTWQLEFHNRVYWDHHATYSPGTI
jgi:2,3-bisphosphoglycerate-dependent phosphoglycerate mutase